MSYKNINISDHFDLIETFAFCNFFSLSIQRLYYEIVQGTACNTAY